MLLWRVGVGVGLGRCVVASHVDVGLRVLSLLLVFVKVERGSEGEVAVGRVQVALCLQRGLVRAPRFHKLLHTVAGSRPVKLASCAIWASWFSAPSDISGG
jgi:hypothetical protein